MEDSLKLLVVTADLGGGTGAHLRMLLREIAHLGWRCRLVCQGAMDLEPPKPVELIGDAVHGRLNRFPFAQARRLAQFRREIANWHPDVVHTYFFWPIVLGRILRRIGLIRALVENREDEGFNLSNLS